MLARTLTPIARAAGRKMSTSTAKFTLPDLTFDYAELEPFISAEIMDIHHKKHHATYVTNLNMFAEKLGEATHKGMTYDIRIHAYTHKHMHIHAYMHTRIQAYTHTRIHAYTHTRIHTYTHTRIHAYTHTRIHTPLTSLSHVTM
jgi:superoxide dismutase